MEFSNLTIPFLFMASKLESAFLSTFHENDLPCDMKKASVPRHSLPLNMSSFRIINSSPHDAQCIPKVLNIQAYDITIIHNPIKRPLFQFHAHCSPLRNKIFRTPFVPIIIFNPTNTQYFKTIIFINLLFLQ